MSSKPDAGHAGASLPGSELFRFSCRPNSAHAIHWRTWGQVAFQEAIQQDKPIFLVLTSSWCQWCHIMDETTLSEASIIAIVNTDYIPIRVDSDMRPDINVRYNQNGWPSVVLLSPEGEILWGGVYVPPTQMLYYLGHIRRYYSEHRQEIVEQTLQLQGTRFTHSLTQTLPPIGGQLLLQEERAALADVPRLAGLVLRDLYDQEYGGFTIHRHLKFPHPEALELLLRLARHEPLAAPQLRGIVSYSLEQMRDGGLWDREDGGFFRYSAASDWSTPHTEKMLEENAALLHLLLHTADATQAPQWYELARKVLLYCNATLLQPEMGVFSGSQSADEEYYEPALYSRATRQRPAVDTTVYTAWNARMVSAYLLAAQVLKQPYLDAIALKALDWLCKHMLTCDADVLYYAMRGGKAGLSGQLTARVWLMRALLDAYERHGTKKYVETASKIMEKTCQDLLDKESGLFFDIPYDECAIGRLSQRMQPLTENALAAECLLRIAEYRTRHEAHEQGLRVLSASLSQYQRTGIQGALYAGVVLEAIEKRWLYP